MREVLYFLLSTDSTTLSSAMLNETCAKWRGAKEELLQESTDSEIFFEKYKLSAGTAMRLESIRRNMRDNIAQADPMWRTIAGEENEEKVPSECEDDSDSDETNNGDPRVESDTQSMQQPSTQFYFTQVERTIELDRPANTPSQKGDILESLCESLERNNGKLDFAQLESLPAEDLVSLVDELAKKLSSKGTYNFCQSMTDMTVEQRIEYLEIFCTHLLLPKIIETEEPSRLLSSAISECVKRFPDETQRFLFVPILNAELKDITLITSIVNAFDSQRKAALLEEFLACVKELRSWHIHILQGFLSVRLNVDMIGILTKLLSEKALCYSRDKNFGKLVLSFLKINTTLSEEQISLIAEVAAVNETIFKKPIENILRNM